MKNCVNQRLVINKVSPNFKEEDILYDLDEVMDNVGIPLIGSLGNKLAGRASRTNTVTAQNAAVSNAELNHQFFL